MDNSQESVDVGRLLRKTLFSALKMGVRKTEYYGGVLVDTEAGKKMAYVRLTFEDLPESSGRE